MEVKWRDERYVPATVDEHLHVSAKTSACQLLSCASFVGMGEIATIESFDWVSNMPKMVHSLCVLLRLSDDLAESYEVINGTPYFIQLYSFMSRRFWLYQSYSFFKVKWLG